MESKNGQSAHIVGFKDYGHHWKSFLKSVISSSYSLRIDESGTIREKITAEKAREIEKAINGRWVGVRKLKIIFFNSQGENNEKTTRSGA